MADSLLPPNATQLERDIEQVQARALLPVEILKLYQPDACPAHLLPWLAWGLSVDEWETRWSEATQRAVIAESVALHRKKGTRWAVQRILNITGLNEPEIFEWWQPRETYDLLPELPTHTFHVRIWSTPEENPVIITHAEYASIRRLIEWTKPARSHFYFDIGARFKRTVGAASGSSAHARTGSAAIPQWIADGRASASLGLNGAGCAYAQAVNVAVPTWAASGQLSAAVGVANTAVLQATAQQVITPVWQGEAKVFSAIGSAAGSAALSFAKYQAVPAYTYHVELLTRETVGLGGALTQSAQFTVKL